VFKAILILLAAGQIAGAQGQSKQEKGPAAPPLKLTIPGFPDGGQLPRKYTCFEPGDIVSPPIKWTNAPPGTVSFVLILHDADGALLKSANDTVHWTVWNIPGNATELPEGLDRIYMVDEQVRQGNTVGVRPGYYRPCPPVNPHHYMFELYALDTTLNLPPIAGRPELLKEMEGHVVGKAVYVGLAHR
jgi:Raf kinase inhibitor-like YbhB/YbcL family protein